MEGTSSGTYSNDGSQCIQVQGRCRAGHLPSRYRARGCHCTFGCGRWTPARVRSGSRRTMHWPLTAHSAQTTGSVPDPPLAVFNLVVGHERKGVSNGCTKCLFASGQIVMSYPWWKMAALERVRSQLFFFLWFLFWLAFSLVPPNFTSAAGLPALSAHSQQQIPKSPNPHLTGVVLRSLLMDIGMEPSPAGISQPTLSAHFSPWNKHQTPAGFLTENRAPMTCSLPRHGQKATTSNVSSIFIDDVSSSATEATNQPLTDNAPSWPGHQHTTNR